jgi:hypothetical protein
MLSVYCPRLQMAGKGLQTRLGGRLTFARDVHLIGAQQLWITIVEIQKTVACRLQPVQKKNELVVDLEGTGSTYSARF